MNNEKKGRETEELERLKKPNTDFKLSLDHQLKNIPDYYGETVRKKKSGAGIFAKIMFAFIVLGVSIFLSLVIIMGVQEVTGVKKPDMSITVDIPETAGVASIAQILEDRGVINSAFLFKAYHKIFDITGNMNYGTYILNSNMSYSAIIEELQKYSKTKEEVKVTFPEGLTIYQMAKKLQESGVCDADEFIEVLNKDEFGFEFEKGVSVNPLKFHRLEGYVFPETYFFYTNDNPINVVKKMLAVFEERVTPEMRQQMADMGYTLEETLTIASIVQKEAGKTAEMRKVASVYFNRLNNNETYPNLQACPTRDYANELKKQMDTIDQTIIDAYNTYEDQGLPPGPICNPGLEAIKATLDPEETEYFYFCTNLKTGEFYYGKTLKEHERNVFKAGLV